MGYHPDVDAAMEKSIAALKAGGADVIDVKMPTYNKWGDPEFEVLLYEFKDGLERVPEVGRLAARVVEGLDRLEHGARADRHAASSARRSSRRPRRRGRSPMPPT